MYIINHRYEPIRIYAVAVKTSDTTDVYVLTNLYYNKNSKSSGLLTVPSDFHRWERYGGIRLDHYNTSSFSYFTSKREAVKAILEGTIDNPDDGEFDSAKYYMKRGTLFIDFYNDSKLVLEQTIKFIPLKMTLDKKKVIYPKRAKFFRVEEDKPVRYERSEFAKMIVGER